MAGSEEEDEKAAGGLAAVTSFASIGDDISIADDADGSKAEDEWTDSSHGMMRPMSIAWLKLR